MIVMHLDIRQCHEVLAEVDNKFVHECWGNVESIQFVVQVVPITSPIKVFIIESKVLINQG